MSEIAAAGKTINSGQALADYIAPLEYGTVIHYQEIEQITKRKWGTGLYYRDIAKAKYLLEAKGKAIAPIGGKDYQVLYPGDYAAAYANQVKLARKRIKRGGHILEGAPVKDMSPGDRSAFNAVYDFHKRMEASIAGSYVEVVTLTEKKKSPMALAAENALNQ